MPFVKPAFEALAKPSISPSDIRSWPVANCLLFRVSGALVGCLGCLGAPPNPLIIFVLQLPD